MLKGNRYLQIGLAITAVITVLAVLGLFWTPYDPSALNSAEMYAPPSLRHLFGTDNFGRDAGFESHAESGFHGTCQIRIQGHAINGHGLSPDRNLKNLCHFQ